MSSCSSGKPIARGLCQCGCGEVTNLAPKTSRRNGWVKGEPLRYIRGHVSRTRRLDPEAVGLSQPNPSGICQCGCGKATPIAPRTVPRLGWVRDAPLRFVIGHAGRKRITFEDGSDYRSEDLGYGSRCWIWLGARCGAYGCVWRGMRGQRDPILAHRMSYEHHLRPIAEGLVIDHLCGVKLCVNPDHLEAVSRGENVRRAAAKRRASRVPPERARGRHSRGARYGNDESPHEVVDAGYATPCWLWLRAVTNNGYPEMFISRSLKTRRRQLYAHRVYWARASGPVPPGHEVDHLCQNRRCVNPEHLQPIPMDVHRARTAERRRAGIGGASSH